MTDSKRGPSGIISIVLTILNGLGLVGFTVALLRSRATFAQMYANFGAVLPSGTIALLSIPSSAIVLVCLLLLTALIGKEFMARKTLPLVLNCVWIVIAITVSIVVSMALMAPMMVEQM